MKAVLVDVPSDLLEQRRKIGADQWDEMWDGVLHMVPSPIPRHQDVEFGLQAWLRTYWVPRSGGRVLQQANVSLRDAGPEWLQNYRIPDLILLTPARFGLEREACFAGGPDAVVEIRSPGDETFEKVPFYTAAGVTELWVVDRDTRVPEIHVLNGDGAGTRVAAAADGWLTSTLGIELRADREARLALRLRGDPTTAASVP